MFQIMLWNTVKNAKLKNIFWWIMIFKWVRVDFNDHVYRFCWNSKPNEFIRISYRIYIPDPSPPMTEEQLREDLKPSTRTFLFSSGKGCRLTSGRRTIIHRGPSGALFCHPRVIRYFAPLCHLLLLEPKSVVSYLYHGAAILRFFNSNQCNQTKAGRRTSLLPFCSMNISIYQWYWIRGTRPRWW